MPLFKVGYFVGSLETASTSRLLSSALVRLAATALKDAIDWAGRPWGKNAFARTPSTAIGTAVARQQLRSGMQEMDAFTTRVYLALPRPSAGG